VSRPARSRNSYANASSGTDLSGSSSSSRCWYYGCVLIIGGIIIIEGFLGPYLAFEYSLRKEDARLQGPFLSALVYWRVHEEMDRPHTPACAGSRSLQLYDVRVILSKEKLRTRVQKHLNTYPRCHRHAHAHDVEQYHHSAAAAGARHAEQQHDDAQDRCGLQDH